VVPKPNDHFIFEQVSELAESHTIEKSQDSPLKLERSKSTPPGSPIRVPDAQQKSSEIKPEDYIATPESRPRSVISLSKIKHSTRKPSYASSGEDLTPLKK